MTAGEFRIESNQPIRGLLWPAAGARELTVGNRGLAVSLAAKSAAGPREEIRVVHVPTGEIVFRKPPAFEDA